MSKIDNYEIKINKNYKCVKLVKFPISGGISPDISFENKRLNNENKKLVKLIIVK